jgi:transposase
MTPPSKPATRFIGCDVGKASIVVFDGRQGRGRTIPNDRDALTSFAAELDDTCLVVCEATGGHEAGLLAALVAAGRAAHRADARKVKAFIRSFGILGKTDAIDARALARYGQERHAELARWQPREAERDRLQTLVLTRGDLVAQRVACGNRLAAPGAEPVRRHLEAVLCCLDTQIAALEADVVALRRASAPLASAARTLRGIAGIGPVTACALIALMPELGHLTRREAAALAGLAPHPNQSGASDAYRRTKGGRPEVKRALFMAAMSAARHNHALRTFYQRLIANGKKPLVALTAVMRKIVVISNALLRHNTPNPKTTSDMI